MTTENYFTLTPARVNKILQSSMVTSRYLHLLSEREDAFKSRLQQELMALVDDAIEMSFLVVVPECIGSRRTTEDCEDCGNDPCTCDTSDEEEDTSHGFEYKDHCEDCEHYWVEYHGLPECIEEGYVEQCSSHSDHKPASCKKLHATCPIHEQVVQPVLEESLTF